MAIAPISIDRTSKPPLGTPLRSDGHWSVQGVKLALPFNEGAGRKAFDTANIKNIVTLGNNAIFSGNLLAVYQDGIDVGSILSESITFSSSWCFICEISVSTLSYTQQILGDNTGTYQFAIEPPGVFQVYAAGPTKSTYQLEVNKKYVLGCSYKDSKVKFYVNGKIVDNITKTLPSMTLDRILSNYSSEYLRTGGYLYNILSSDKVPTDDQVASISANQWQIYEPETVLANVGATGVFLPAWAINNNHLIQPGIMV